MPPLPPSPESPLRTAAAWAPLGLGTVLALGTDAPRFVDGFTTAALGGLPAGTGTEGFFTDARGWVLALATILRTDAGLVILLDAERAAGLREHLEHYHIREPVELVDATPAMATLLVAGPRAGEWLADRIADPLPREPLTHTSTRLFDRPVRLVRTGGQGADGWLVHLPGDAADALAAAFLAAGLPRAESADVEAARIEARYPAAADIPPRTLPQELDRDARAISFTKGCYLGQETVARLDALGHVNRRLVLVAVAADEPPPPGAAVRQGDEEVGTVGSGCRSREPGSALVLAIVHVKALGGGPLEVGGAAGRVVPGTAGGGT